MLLRITNLSEPQAASYTLKMVIVYPIQGISGYRITPNDRAGKY